MMYYKKAVPDLKSETAQSLGLEIINYRFFPAKSLNSSLRFAKIDTKVS